MSVQLDVQFIPELHDIYFFNKTDLSITRAIHERTIQCNSGTYVPSAIQERIKLVQISINRN